MYALAYTNWNAATLPAHERRLAALGWGAARHIPQQTAASQSGLTALADNHVQNHGTVLSIAEGEGSAYGYWVVVTQERTTGTGVYSGLPPSPHITLARAKTVRGRWVVTMWRPQS